MVWPTADIPTYGRGVWLECNGQSFSRTQFPQLYETLGTTRVPDYQGMFLRGYGSQSYSQDNGDAPSNTTYASGNIGQIQGDSIRHFSGIAGSVGAQGDLGYGYFTDESSFFDSVKKAGSEIAPAITYPSPWDTYRTLMPWEQGPNTDYSLQTSERPYYRYTLESSGGGEDGEASYNLIEEEVHYDTIPLGLYTTYIDSSLALPTSNEIRPVNVAVKFMIKAK